MSALTAKKFGGKNCLKGKSEKTNKGELTKKEVTEKSVGLSSGGSGTMFTTESSLCPFPKASTQLRLTTKARTGALSRKFASRPTVT